MKKLTSDMLAYLSEFNINTTDITTFRKDIISGGDANNNPFKATIEARDVGGKIKNIPLINNSREFTEGLFWVLKFNKFIQLIQQDDYHNTAKFFNKQSPAFRSIVTKIKKYTKTYNAPYLKYLYIIGIDKETFIDSIKTWQVEEKELPLVLITDSTLLLELANTKTINGEVREGKLYKEEMKGTIKNKNMTVFLHGIMTYYRRIQGDRNKGFKIDESIKSCPYYTARDLIKLIDQLSIKYNNGKNHIWWLNRIMDSYIDSEYLHNACNITRKSRESIKSIIDSNKSYKQIKELILNTNEMYFILRSHKERGAKVDIEIALEKDGDVIGKSKGSIKTGQWIYLPILANREQMNYGGFTRVDAYINHIVISSYIHSPAIKNNYERNQKSPHTHKKVERDDVRPGDVPEKSSEMVSYVVDERGEAIGFTIAKLAEELHLNKETINNIMKKHTRLFNYTTVSEKDYNSNLYLKNEGETHAFIRKVNITPSANAMNGISRSHMYVRSLGTELVGSNSYNGRSFRPDINQTTQEFSDKAVSRKSYINKSLHAQTDNKSRNKGKLGDNFADTKTYYTKGDMIQDKNSDIIIYDETDKTLKTVSLSGDKDNKEQSGYIKKSYSIMAKDVAEANSKLNQVLLFKDFVNRLTRHDKKALTDNLLYKLHIGTYQNHNTIKKQLKYDLYQLIQVSDFKDLLSSLKSMIAEQRIKPEEHYDNKEDAINHIITFLQMQYFLSIGKNQDKYSRKILREERVIDMIHTTKFTDINKDFNSFLADASSVKDVTSSVSYALKKLCIQNRLKLDTVIDNIMMYGINRKQSNNESYNGSNNGSNIKVVNVA